MKTFKLSILLTFLFMNQTFASKFYWVGNGGNWNDLKHWSNISGGSGDVFTSVPSAQDTIYFDELSFTVSNQVVNTEIFDFMGIQFKAMDWTGVTNNPTFNWVGYSMLVDVTYIKLSENMTFSSSAISVGTYSNEGNITKITTKGHHFHGLYLKGKGTFEFLDEFHSNFIEIGCNILFNQNLYINGFFSINSQDYPISIETNTIDIFADRFSYYKIGDEDAIVDFSKNDLYLTSSLRIKPNGSFLSQSGDNGWIFQSVTFNNPSGNGNYSIDGSNTYVTLTIYGPGNILIEENTTQTIENLELISSESMALKIKANKDQGSKINITGSEICVENITVSNITLIGKKITAGKGSKNEGNNPNWEFSDSPCGLTSVESSTKPSFAIYPNPAKTTLNISGNLELATKIQIVNALGNTLLEISPEENIIDIENLNPGIYFLQIWGSESTIQLTKFMKQ